MATNFMKNGKLPTFVPLAFRNGRDINDTIINSVNDASISCENFVKFHEFHEIWSSNSRVDKAHL